MSQPENRGARVPLPGRLDSRLGEFWVENPWDIIQKGHNLSCYERKRVFLNVAGLLDTFESGTYLLNDKDVSRLSDSEMSRIRNQNIGFVFQSFNLIPDLNVFNNVDVPLRYRRLSGGDRKRRIEGALELVGLTSRWKHLPSQLSGGQQQRVAIARVLAGDPKLILADEPTGNLDSLMAREIMDLLDQINSRGT